MIVYSFISCITFECPVLRHHCEIISALQTHIMDHNISPADTYTLFSLQHLFPRVLCNEQRKDHTILYLPALHPLRTVVQVVGHCNHYIIITSSRHTVLRYYHVTWNELLQRPASQPMHTPVLLRAMSSHNWQALLPHLEAANWSSVTPLSSKGSMYSTLGVYNMHTTCTHLLRGGRVN